MKAFAVHQQPRPKELEEQHTTCTRTYCQLRVLKNLIGNFIDSNTSVAPTRFKALIWGFRGFFTGVFPSDDIHFPVTTLIELYRDIEANLQSLEYMNKEDKL